MNLNKSSMHQEQPCLCQQSTTLVIDRKIISQLVAIALLCGFFLFAAGYFLGKKKATEPFCTKVEQEAFSDQMNLAFHALYQSDMTEHKGEQEEQTLAANVSEQKIQVDAQDNVNNGIPEQQEAVKRYQALLMGGSSKDVNSFIARLNKRGIQANIKKRQSKIAKGKVITWFQAVSPEFSNKKELDKLIDNIKATEKIKGIKIVELA